MLITASLQPGSALQSVDRSCRNVRILLGRHRAPQPVLGAVPATVFRCAGSSSVCSRPSVSCGAEPEPVSGYTPADYISFSNDENKQCHHNAEVWVDAPLDTCYSLWSDWTKLLDFLDLIGQIGLDNGNPHMAMFQCFYRYRKLPLMEIVFLLEREEREETLCKSLVFKSVYGMPMKGEVQLSEQLDGKTRVRLYFTHPVPNLLVQLQIGPFGVETDVKQILEENLAAYKQQAEALAPPDYQQQKAAIGERVQSTLDKLKQESAEVVKKLQQQQTEAEQQEQQEQQQQAQQEEQQQAQQEEQQQPPSAAAEQQQQPDAAPKRPRGRTASKASAAAADAAGPPAAQAGADAAAGAASEAAGQPPAGRGRKTTRGRTAAATPAGDGSSSSSAGKRRSRMSSSSAAAPPADDGSSSNGTGSSGGSSAGAKSSGRRSTTRRSSKRPSTAAKE